MASECLACKFQLDECTYRKNGFCAGCGKTTRLYHVGIDDWACDEECADKERRRRDREIVTAQEIAEWVTKQDGKLTPSEVAQAIKRGDWRRGTPHRSDADG